MITLKCSSSWSSHKKWIISNIFLRFGAEIVIQFEEQSDWILTVAGLPGSIKLPDIFFKSIPPEGVCSGLSPADTVPWCKFSTGNFEENLPVLFGTVGSRWGLPITVGSNVSFEVDIFGSAYWSMARIEELIPGQRDEHDRFSAFQSHAWKNRYLGIPFVDEYVNLLKEIFVQVWPVLQFSKYETFRQFISHDVDDPYLFQYMSSLKAMRLITANAIKGKSPFLGLKWTAGLGLSRMNLRLEDPCDSFDWLMERSENAGVKSCFYFIASDRSCFLDADYDVCDPKIIDLIRRINRRGHEVGIHPGYLTYRNPENLARQLSRFKVALSNAGIEENLLGGRMHFLRWDSRYTPKELAAAGLNYDSTLGFADQPGFRCGTCHPFTYFDPVNEVATELLLRPLVVMESTVIARRYMNLGATDKAFSVFSNLKNRCRRVGGEFSLLWHNSSLFSSAERELYEEVIKT
jgi:hypothetical protein